MPTVFEVRCDRCDHRTLTTAIVSYVRDDAGRLVVLPHPDEAGTAERVTGRTFGELLDEHRVVYRAPLVCRGCGELSEHAIGGERGFLHSITYHPTAEDIASLRCPHCDAALLCLEYPDPQAAAVTRALLVPPIVTALLLAAAAAFLHDRAPIAFWILFALAILGTVAFMARQLNRVPDTPEPPAAPCPRCAEGQLEIQDAGDC